jgi:hypothetical protein
MMTPTKPSVGGMQVWQAMLGDGEVSKMEPSSAD